MTPEHFISKWKASELKERSAAQSHFNDLCTLLDEATPTDADPKGEWYCFERGATKTTGSDGWADVWKRYHFGWEYKGKHKDLDAAYVQLQQYAVALENPPLLVVCDMERFRIHTNWTNTVSVVHEFKLDDLAGLETRQKLKYVFTEVDQLKPTRTRDALTAEVAKEFAALAQSLRERGHDPQETAHFINRLVFCMFAEDIGLLPSHLFSQMLEAVQHHPDQFEGNARQLFSGMRTGGVVAFKKIDWFNGGLFDDDHAIPLTRDEIRLVLQSARKNWSDIDPSILGTLFERGLDPDKRSQLGAHYTDRDKIMMIVEPVVLRPLEREWKETKDKIEATLSKASKSKGGAKTRALNDAERHRQHFMERLRQFRVLDPACGSGNFLYLSLLSLKDLEHRINLECEALGLHREFPSIGPEVVKGIEINPYAAELARVTVWIGEIQWMKRNGFDVSRNPILKPLETIECRDAILTEAGGEAAWPDANCIIGNPPFLGSQLFLDRFGGEYSTKLRECYQGRVPQTADLVTYWFAKALEFVKEDSSRVIGLVATSSIRTGGSRYVLDQILKENSIFEAWSDEPWVVEGAAVTVSLVCFSSNQLTPIRLNGENVSEIRADLSPVKEGVLKDVDFTKTVSVVQNRNSVFQGSKKIGPFEVPGELARQWLALPSNPNGRPNSDVLRLSWIAIDVVRRARDIWIIDFGLEMSEAEASLYESPFQYVHEQVRPRRILNNRESRRRYWWRHGDGQPAMRRAVGELSQFIVTPEVSKHRIFQWAPTQVLPDCKLMVIAREDDITFGILQSKFHELWTLRKCGWHGAGNDPRYTPSTTFETFPFPEGLSPDIPACRLLTAQNAQAIAEAARNLVVRRDIWLNPPDLVLCEAEVAPGYPDRLLPIDDKAAAILKKRTLTNLYNERPAWLDNAHRELDEAVAAAYGWPSDLDDNEILRRLFELNQERTRA